MKDSVMQAYYAVALRLKDHQVLKAAYVEPLPDVDAAREARLKEFPISETRHFAP